MYLLVITQSNKQCPLNNYSHLPDLPDIFIKVAFKRGPDGFVFSEVSKRGWRCGSKKGTQKDHL
jgi:hypothetical protein